MNQILPNKQIYELNNYIVELGDIAANAFYSFNYDVYAKHKNDVVTSIDKKIEESLKEHIASNFPEHAIISEESKNKKGNQYVWYIDPLDGTKNFVNHIPFFSIAVALFNKESNKFIYSSVYNPISKELFFYDSKNTYLSISGSKENKKRLPLLNNSKYISIGNPGMRFSEVCNSPYFSKLNYRIRQLGSASLELAYVSAGYLDGALFFNLHEWDYMAGIGLLMGAGINYMLKKNALVCGNNSFNDFMLLLDDVLGKG